VIVEAVRRSPLAAYAHRFAELSAANPADLILRERPFLAKVNLRTDPTDAGVMQRLASALGFVLPVAPNTTAATEDRRALWLGPDEWLIVGPEDQEDVLEQALRDGLNGAVGSIVDVSASRTVLEVRGAKTRDLLAHGVPIDLDARSFAPGHCAQTLLGKAQVIIVGGTDEAAFHLYVRSSFACYAADWLLDATANPNLRSAR
jgi:sarcosine oxidase subunit gamma